MHHWIPTANILISDTYKLIPLDGVYAVKVKHNNIVYNGMLNIGNNPTVAGKDRSVEVNIFDFDNDIYEQEISIYFVERMRNEEKFSGLEALKLQLAKDKENAIRITNT